jgi:hypothetical protein
MSAISDSYLELPLPTPLVQLMESGRWRQPADDIIKRAVPFITDPMDFLITESQIRRESTGKLADDARSSQLFHVYHGRGYPTRSLPWLDVDMSLMIAVNRELGADVAIAIDLRTSALDPRVVATDWVGHGKETRSLWREVSPSFTQFIEKLGL